MIVYSIYDTGSEGPEYFTSLRAAKARARELVADGDCSEMEVSRDEVVPLKGRALAVCLLSGEGWSRSSEIVFTARAKP